MIFSYDTVKFPFEKITQSYLGCDDLTLVHKNSLFKQTLAEGTDQAQFLHKKFYNSMDTDSKQRFVTIYRQFIREVIFSFYREPILFQRFPTFRVHQPSNIAVFLFFGLPRFFEATHFVPPCFTVEFYVFSTHCNIPRQFTSVGRYPNPGLVIFFIASFS